MSSTHTEHVSYGDLFKELSEKKLASRFETLLVMMNTFVNKAEFDDSVKVNELLLGYALLDYFSDVSRIKTFHKIELINETKIIAYEAYWLLRHKPIQVLVADIDAVSVNELFVISLIDTHLNKECHNDLGAFDSDEILKFYDFLLYFLKYRTYNAQIIELALTAFCSGWDNKAKITNKSAISNSEKDGSQD